MMCLIVINLDDYKMSFYANSGKSFETYRARLLYSRGVIKVEGIKQSNL